MSINVLVVDDSAVMRAMIIRILRLTGLPLDQVYEAPDGREALKILVSNAVDLALVDINMPVMNGEALIDNVRNNKSIADLPIIVVSTESSIGPVERIRRKNVEFVHKPFTPEIIRKTILQFIGVPDEELSRKNSVSEVGPDF